MGTHNSAIDRNHCGTGVNCPEAQGSANSPAALDQRTQRCPSLVPGLCVPALMIAFFEDIDSELGIA